MEYPIIEELMTIDNIIDLGNFDLYDKNLTTILSSDDTFNNRDVKSSMIKNGYANSFTTKSIKDKKYFSLKENPYLSVENYKRVTSSSNENFNAKITINVDHDLFYDKNSNVAIFYVHKDNIKLIIGRKINNQY